MKALFYPGSPLAHERYTINAVLAHLGCAVTLDPEDAVDFAVAWLDRTHVPPQPILDVLARRMPVVNHRCTDISKRRVEAVFREVFGYGTFIDPTTHHGPCVKKFDENAWGGVLVEAPLPEADARFVYQPFIDTRRDGLLVEHRTPVVLGTLPMVFLLYKDLPTRGIKTEKRRIEFAETDAVFSAEEQRGILRFCHLLGLDFGELDILRANEDGRLYILDANKTAGGPPVAWLPPEEQTAKIAALAEAFEQGLRRMQSEGGWELAP